MSRFLMTAIFLFILFSCSAEREEQSLISSKLHHWDSIIYEHPAGILDSLISIENKELSKENSTYKSLLTCIASYWNDTSLTDRTAIFKAADWYKRKSDYRNLSRSLLYMAIVKYKDGPLSDSTKYYSLKAAESVYYSNKLDDIFTEALLNKYLGSFMPVYEWKYKLSTFSSSLSDSKKHIDKSIDLFTRLGYEKEIQLANFDKVSLYKNHPASDRNDKFKILAQISAYDTLLPEIRQKLYWEYITYYFDKNDYENVALYCKKYISEFQALKKDTILFSNIISQLASCYLEQGQTDSAFKYITVYKDFCAHNFLDTTNSHPLYKRYYEITGDYKNAYELNLKYQQTSSKKLSNYTKDVQLKKDYKLRQLQQQVNNISVQRDNAFMLAAISTVVAVVALVTFSVIILRRGRRYKQERNTAGEMLSSRTILHTRLWLTNEVLKASVNLIPSFVDEVGKEAGRCRKISSDTYDNIMGQINDLKMNNKDLLSDIIKNESFKSLFPDIVSLNDLSSYEKLILALFEIGYNTKEIASLLANTKPGIRSIKSRIKEKILCLSDLPYNPLEKFVIFSKESGQKGEATEETDAEN
jgi:hypothetical protein